MPQDAPFISETTRDAIYDGRLTIVQPRQGYRFSVDAYLLVWFASQGRRSKQSIDLGAGSGIVGLGLLAAGVTDRVVAVEVQPGLARLAQENAALNCLDTCYEMILSDVKELAGKIEPGRADLVATNPPFWPVANGRLPREEERRVACHEVLSNIGEWVKAASLLLHPSRGRLCTVFPARRLDSLILAESQAGLSPCRLCMVHPAADKGAELVLVEARRGNSGRLDVDPPLILKQADGRDTPEIAAILSGNFSDDLKVLPDRR
jgi:tRNA1Val (adenine37-N6)-methyltransferase